MESSGSLKLILTSSYLGSILAGSAVCWILINIESESVSTNDAIQENIAVGNGDSALSTKKKDISRKKLTYVDRGIIAATVGVLVVVNYLLLVVTGGPLWLSTIANIAIITIFLRPQISDDIKRERFDRLSAIVALFLFIACTLSIATYAYRAIAEGNIYRGPARIIGYDDTKYTNDGEEVTRTDLEVAWGSSWGCARDENQCKGFVNGAMCETEVNTEANDDGSLYSGDDDDDFGSYYNNWDMDWNSIWGDYACSNLFESAMDDKEFDADEPPGNDGWPFLNIYGNCNSCEAYVVDYYSTQHFNNIKKFKTQARNYFISSISFLGLTAGIIMRNRLASTKEHKESFAKPDFGSELVFELS